MPSTTWSTTDLGGITLSGGNLIATASTTSAGVRSALSQSTGKQYWEYTAGTFAGGNTSFGIANANALLTLMGGVPTNACLVYNTGNIWLNNANTGATLAAISSGTIVGIALDMTGLLLWLRIAPAGNWNGSGTANPGTGVGGISISSIFGGALPAFAAFASATIGNATTANFGSAGFTGAVPAGFTGGFPSGTAAPTTQARAMVLA